MSKNFLKTNEAKQIIIFEDKGYRLTSEQSELTIPQELFLFFGWEWINKEKEKEAKKHQNKIQKGR
jgi:hypothetical protein